jgi:hypothetical protein
MSQGYHNRKKLRRAAESPYSKEVRRKIKRGELTTLALTELPGQGVLFKSGTYVFEYTKRTPLTSSDTGFLAGVTVPEKVKVRRRVRWPLVVTTRLYLLAQVEAYSKGSK